MGDGGFSEGTGLTFPIDSGLKDQIIQIEFAAEADNLPDDKYSDQRATMYSITKMLGYDGDTLVEIPSIDLEVRNRLCKEFPRLNETENMDYPPSLFKYELIDIDNDGDDDALFYLSYSVDQNAGYREDDHVYKLGYMLNSPNGFEKIYTNDQLSRYAPRVAIYMKDGLVFMDLAYNSDGSDINTNNALRVLNAYRFDDELGKLIWSSRKEQHDVSEPDKWRIQWSDAETQYFKTKKILFEESW